jgi:hypothetical protein
MTYAYHAWEFAADNRLLKLQRLQNEVLRITRFDYWIYCHFFTITTNYYSSQSMLTIDASLHSASRSTTDSKQPSLSPINLRHGPHRKHSYCRCV